MCRLELQWISLLVALKGTIYNVERCKIEEDEVSIDYSLFEGNSIEKPIFYISVLKE